MSKVVYVLEHVNGTVGVYSSYDKAEEILEQNGFEEEDVGVWSSPECSQLRMYAFALDCPELNLSFDED